MVTLGKGNHGGGPSDNNFDALKSLTVNSNFKVDFTSTKNYFKKFRNHYIDWPVKKTEFGISSVKNQKGSGCYTSQAIIKKLNRYYKNQLISAEKIPKRKEFHWWSIIHIHGLSGSLLKPE